MRSSRRPSRPRAAPWGTSPRAPRRGQPTSRRSSRADAAGATRPAARSRRWPTTRTRARRGSVCAACCSSAPCRPRPPTRTTARRSPEGLVLRADEARTLARWLDAGTPRGEGDAPATPVAETLRIGHEIRAVSAEAITIPAGEGEGRARVRALSLPAAVAHPRLPAADGSARLVVQIRGAVPGRAPRDAVLAAEAFAGPWRQTYALAQPGKRVPAGTLVYATGGFERNSRRNPVANSVAGPPPHLRRARLRRALSSGLSA